MTLILFYCVCLFNISLVCHKHVSRIKTLGLKQPVTVDKKLYGFSESLIMAFTKKKHLKIMFSYKKLHPNIDTDVTPAKRVVFSGLMEGCTRDRPACGSEVEQRAVVSVCV